MQKQETLLLAERAAEIRLRSVDAIYHAKSGHPGGSLSISDLLAYLYFKELRIDPANPQDPARDRFVLSKGHCCPALYAALAIRGFFPVEDLNTLRKLGSYLSGHPDMKNVPGVDMSTGSLGQGISAAAGMALVGKREGAPYRVYAVLGDGELQEGQVWEAAMFAGHYGLDNLIAFVDFNHLQIDGDVREVMNPTPIDRKFEAFGWYAQCIDGHSFDALETAIENAKRADKPAVIVMTTVKGKGVSFMENQSGWHGKAPKAEEYEIAMKELTATYETCKEATIHG
ncbi:MAG: transketolase [Oscillospiraceae bacterium]|nr:transketolase [Oscillospiraceae bacterium]